MHGMNKRLLFGFLALAVLHAPHQASAQFTDAHTYDNTPVGINQLELSYAYAHSDSSIDTSLVITGAKLNLNQGAITYTRYFGALHRLMWAQASLPIGDLSGSIAGTSVQGSITGSGDSSYQAAMLLKGGPALTISQFEIYKPKTIVGVSLTITAPTGLYNPVKILNLGSERWYFKPEFALSHPFGSEQKWQLDTYINSYFYTNNTSYRGTGILRQQPLPGVEGHISYSLNDTIWASLDTRYSFRGRTFVNDSDQGNGQRNFILGSEINLSINNKNSLLFEFADALVHHNGPALVGFSIKYNYTWGKGYK